jgi:hypothetical protein
MRIKKTNLTSVPPYLPRQRGASLLEGIAYLGIAAIVVLGAVSLLTNAFGSAESNRTSEEVTSIRTAVRKLYMGQPYTAAVLNPTVSSAGVFPATLQSGALGAVTNAWGGAVVVTGTGPTFTVSYAAVPQDVCITTLSTASGWTQVAVNGAAPLQQFPITPATAAGATGCGLPANTIVFTAI